MPVYELAGLDVCPLESGLESALTAALDVTGPPNPRHELSGDPSGTNQHTGDLQPEAGSDGTMGGIGPRGTVNWRHLISE